MSVKCNINEARLPFSYVDMYTMTAEVHAEITIDG